MSGAHGARALAVRRFAAVSERSAGEVRLEFVGEEGEGGAAAEALSLRVDECVPPPGLTIQALRPHCTGFGL